MLSPSTPAPPAAPWQPRCCPTGQGAARNSPRSCPPTTSGCCRPPGWPRPRAATSTPRSWRPAVADPHGFLEVAKVEAAQRPVDERVGDWREVYELQDPHARGGEVA